MRIEFFGPWRNRLGESPLWDPASGLLFWVDAVAQRLCCAEPSAAGFRVWPLDDVIGSIALAEGGLLAAMGDGFYFIEVGDEANATAIACPELGNASVRFNDGKADRRGHFLAGTMRLGECAESPGVLYRLEHDGRCTVLEREIAVSNALCFSPSGDTLYFADSLRSLLWRYDYDAISGALSGRQPFIDTRPLGSVPDGATVDAAGELWIALFNTQQIAHYASDGALIRLIDLPVPYPSCPAFGGPDLQTLFVTTISDSGNRIKTDHPAGGRMLMIEGLGVCGIPESRCQVTVPPAHKSSRSHHSRSAQPR